MVSSSALPTERIRVGKIRKKLVDVDDFLGELSSNDKDSRSPNITMKNLAFSTNEIWLGTFELANIVGQYLPDKSAWRAHIASL